MEQKMSFKQFKEELKKQIQILRKGWNDFLTLCCASPHHLRFDCFDFDINEILCAPNTVEHFNKTFQECSLEDLFFEEWLCDLLRNIDHWKQGEWIQDDSWNKEED